jgi:pimeloyl-ACP methyl ester carboxylesterase
MPKIKTPKGIATFENIVLGGEAQVLSIRSHNIENPILLMLHGGPGTALMPFAHVSDRALEEHYIVVHWDQRGAGKSYHKALNPGTMHIEQYLEDIRELIAYLCKKFNKEKVYLLGHSWGSYLGIRMAHEHPEMLHAYIGMGQVINMPEAEKISYKYTLAQAAKAGKKKAIKALEDIGPPPYSDHKALLTERKWLTMCGGLVANCSLLQTLKYRFSSPEYSYRDHMLESKGRDFSLQSVWPEFQQQSVENSIEAFQIPVYFMEGRYDYCVPSELAERFVQKVKSPYKEIIWFEHSAHLMNVEEPQKYQRVLIEKVPGKNEAD